MVVADQQDHQGQLGVHPALGQPGGIEDEHPDAEDQGGEHRRQHDAAVELALHHAEAFAAGLVLAHRVVDEESRQVEQAGEPADHGDDVHGFEPEIKHGVLLVSRLR
ncbi:hypothetical protein FQZ97_1064640 [compost metagenome]